MALARPAGLQRPGRPAIRLPILWNELSRPVGPIEPGQPRTGGGAPERLLAVTMGSVGVDHDLGLDERDERPVTLAPYAA